MIQHTASLPHGYIATFTYSSAIGFRVEWQPAVPYIRNARHLRRFMAAYTAARDAFMADLAGMVGGRVLTVDVSKNGVKAITVAEPPTRH